MTIGEKIKQLRIENNMTQEKCAEALGVSRQSLSAWENGRILPDFRSIVAISDLFHVSIDSLIREDEAVVNRLAEIEDTEKNRRLLIRRISSFAYLLAWAMLVAIYWITGNAGKDNNSVVAYDVILGAITAIISFFIGFDREWGGKKWFLSLFFGVMYFLAGYITFDISDYLISGDFHIPDLIFLLPGTALSVAGICTGEIASAIRVRSMRK